MKTILINNQKSNYCVTPEGAVINKITKKTLGDFINPTTGYHYVSMFHGGKNVKMNVHRLVAIYYLSGRKKGKEVNHINGDKANNTTSNLEWVTRQQNMKAYRKPQFSNKKTNDLDRIIIQILNITMSKIAVSKVMGYSYQTIIKYTK